MACPECGSPSFPIIDDAKVGYQRITVTWMCEDCDYTEEKRYT